MVPKVHAEERRVVLLMPLYKKFSSPLLLSLVPSLKARCSVIWATFFIASGYIALGLKEKLWDLMSQSLSSYRQEG